MNDEDEFESKLDEFYSDSATCLGSCLIIGILIVLILLLAFYHGD